MFNSTLSASKAMRLTSDFLLSLIPTLQVLILGYWLSDFISWSFRVLISHMLSLSSLRSFISLWFYLDKGLKRDTKSYNSCITS
jgi:hypothetical protein